MIAVIDYGVGNLFSLCSSLKKTGADTVITNDAEIIKKADKLILPGVGAFEDAAKKLSALKLDKIIIEEAQDGKPLLGICLGMQLLFERSYEFGEHTGLGIIKGEIVPMHSRIPKDLKIPHIGWNRLDIVKESLLFRYIKNGEYVYFVHSFYASKCDESIIANTEYGVSITAAVCENNVYGCQFHPEKSGETGAKILKAFCETGDIQ